MLTLECCCHGSCQHSLQVIVLVYAPTVATLYVETGRQLIGGPSKPYQDFLGSIEAEKRGTSLFFLKYIFHKRKLEFLDDFSLVHFFRVFDGRLQKSILNFSTNFSTAIRITS